MLNEQDKGKIDVSNMKQGDWLCPKCNFMNFTRNIRCLRCDSFFEERINQLKEDNNHLPLKKGDWICNKIQDVCNAKKGLPIVKLIPGSGNVTQVHLHQFQKKHGFPEM
eukprot:XP_014618592.1 uncharacterized protein LOC102669698 isoform X2 [Glycine max]